MSSNNKSFAPVFVNGSYFVFITPCFLLVLSKNEKTLSHITGRSRTLDYWLCTVQSNLEPLIFQLTQALSYDLLRPLDRLGNSYGPAGIQSCPHVLGCKCFQSHCPLPKHTWTAHPSAHWKTGPPSYQQQGSSPERPQWSASLHGTSAGGSES